MGSITSASSPVKIPDDKLKQHLETYFETEISTALFEKIQEMVDVFIQSDEVTVCPHCKKLFLESEDALEYEQSNGEYTCDCLSPENQAASLADYEIDMDGEK